MVRVDDADGIVELGRIVNPSVLSTPASMKALLEAESVPTTERLVGESEGRVVAWAPSGIYESGVGWFWIGVQPEVRGRGIGAAIYDHIEMRLRAEGASRLETAPDNDEGRRFLTTRGFDVSRTVRLSEIDPRRLSAEAQPPPGVEVVSLREMIDQPETLYELYSQGRADIPSQVPHAQWTLGDWRAATLDHPWLDLDASVVALEHGEPVSLAWLYSDREGHRAETLLATTRRDRRGHGLATLAKIESTRRAATFGITRILTGNDLGNAPMLAINDKLGYTATVVTEFFAKSLGGPSL